MLLAEDGAEAVVLEDEGDGEDDNVVVVTSGVLVVKGGFSSILLQLPLYPLSISGNKTGRVGQWAYWRCS